MATKSSRLSWHPHRSLPHRRKRFAALTLSLLAASAGRAADVVDRLGLPGSITYNGTVYELRWSAQSNPQYFKQEYLPPGQSLERFERMLLLELVASGIDVDTAVSAQVRMLDRRKQDDPVVNYDALRDESTGEVILDFLMSDRSESGEVIVEWNAYRYAPYIGADGSTGVMLLGISRRAYGDAAARDFLIALKTEQPGDIDALARHALPRVAVQRGAGAKE